MLELVDIRPVTELARKDLPSNSTFRMILEAEQDWVPRHEILGKLVPWQTLLRAELAERGS